MGTLLPKLDISTLYDWLDELKLEASHQDIDIKIVPDNYGHRQLSINSQIKNQLDKLFYRILDFIPEGCKIKIGVASIKNKEICINVFIQGIDLYRITEILSITQLKVNRIHIEGTNTQYQIYVPTGINAHWEKPLNFSPYYIEMNKSLRNHFFGKGSKEEACKINKDHHILLNKINKLLELHLQDGDYGVAELAKSLNMSRTHLYRKVKEITEKSPLSYIMIFKLELAKQLLKDTKQDLSVTEVAYSCGFSDKGHFSRSFKKYFGITPSSFKKQAM
ncbi:AraC family transcriptional regulator [Winogradskyella sp.]|uniref:helix-turn-helix domain-containing protein n=1 Tax=Winogradskyella sp. TaxID=1883156 RepID=UPI002636875E|nr:AraC family transcriptional regulator [Winogradskyella sp.]